MDRHIFGQRVRESRERLGITQVELGERCGLQPTAICFIETGARVPSLPTLIALANGLGESIDSLVGIGDNNTVFSTKDVEKLIAAFQAALTNMRAEALAEKVKS